MELNDETTWPTAVVEYLGQHYDLLLAWEMLPEQGAQARDIVQALRMAAEYDQALTGLRPILNSATLHGYHCTRLTDAEIAHVTAEGMQLPNRAMLCRRINVLERNGLIEPALAEQLKQKNQADELNRASMIWFCFYPPHLAGEYGIESLLRLWGGEALYNSHDRDALIGPILRRIGTPCLIEADVPIASFPPHTFLEKHLYRQFLISRGLKTSEPVHHENRATQPIPAQNIRRIIRYPEPDFIALTRCDTWREPPDSQ
ncbi:MAG: hypothetical protein LAO30_19600 [Acidobacteriia bacterium]|nr:hypothetical protein [Terriglobia bacterium]